MATKAVDMGLLNTLKHELGYTYSKFQAFGTGSITFVGKATNKRVVLTKDTQEQWKNTLLRLQKLTDTLSPSTLHALKQHLMAKNRAIIQKPF